MRKILVALSLCASLLPSSAHAQSVGGYISESFEAHTDWIARGSRPGSPLFRYVSVTRDEKVGSEAETMVQIGQVRCTSRASRRSYFYSCKTSGRLLFVKRALFQVDGALRSARVVFRTRGTTNEVRWKGRDDQPEPSYGLQGGERALVARATLTARATVRGAVLGERFSTTRRKARASLRRGIHAGAIHGTNARHFTIEASSRATAWRNLRRAIGTL